MIIQNHDVQLNSSRETIEHHEKNERLVAWQGNIRIDTGSSEEESSIRTGAETNRSVLLDISQEAMNKFLASPTATAASFIEAGQEEEGALPPKLQMMKILLEKFFGIKIKITKPGNENSTGHPEQTHRENTAEPQPQGWGMHYTYHELHYKKDAVHFSAAGTVTTEDGRKLDFEAQLEMSKETLEEINIDIRAGDALIDPLVVNLDGKGAALTDEKFAFDLDADGERENISFVTQGSGFLALDKNQNGVVDDGSELFGPATNNGFLELKAYDEDQNQWIDETDGIFYDLKVWTRDEEGADQLTPLSAYDIGAIYLAGSGTDFDLGEGRLRETGIYLNENGTPGFIQEVDLRAT
ncbi:MAG: VCBS repeat-containing protein [bacterium]|nr:VCBS repeat-containing protein [bacterium]